MRLTASDLAPEAEKVIDQIGAALPGNLRGPFNALQDYLGFLGTCQAEAAFAIGLAVGRRGCIGGG